MVMDFHPHVGAAVAKDPLRLMPNLDITDILTTDTAITDTDMVFLDVALPTLEVTPWERGQLRLRLNLHITVLDMDMALTDLILDTVLTDPVSPDTHLVHLSPTEVSKVSASKCAISDVV